MKKLLLALAVCVSLAGCKDQTSADGYHFDQTSQGIGYREIKVDLYPSFAAIKADYNKQGNGRKLASNESLQAYSVIDEHTCTIHMIDPKVVYQPEFFGHELTHCLYGNFHPTQDER